MTLKCPQCGSLEDRAQSRFCRVCGAAIRTVAATLVDEPPPPRTIPQAPAFAGFVAPPAYPRPEGARVVTPALAALFAPRPRSFFSSALGFAVRFTLTLALGVLSWNGVGVLLELVLPLLNDPAPPELRPLLSPILFCALTFVASTLISVGVFGLTTRRRKGFLA